MSLSESISNIQPKTGNEYTARASIKDGQLDASSSLVTGNRDTRLFSGQSELGKQDFLQLLVKQLQYQDPLKPMENTEFVSQLAQFSSLEGNVNIENAIKDLGDSFESTVAAQKESADSLDRSSAISLIGKEVRLKMNSFRHDRGQKNVLLDVHLGENSSAVVDVMDSEDNIVKTLKADNKDSKNSASVYWDGTGPDGKEVPGGTYYAKIRGEEDDDSLYLFMENTVEGIRFTQEGPIVKINGREITADNIMDVSGKSSSTGFNGIDSSSAVSLLGKTVQARTGIMYMPETGASISTEVSTGNYSEVTVDVIDKNDEVVKSIQVDGTDGRGNVVWDGRNSNGEFMKEGYYYFHIQGEENDPGLYCYTEGTVDGVNTSGGDVRLKVNGALIPLASIIEFSYSGNQEETA